MIKIGSRFQFNPYPLIIPLFPVFSFVLYNLRIVSLSSVAIGILVPTAAMIIAWAVIRRLVDNPDKADLIAAVLGIFFFTYRHFQTVVSIILILINGSSFDAIEKFGVVNNHPDVLRNILIGWMLLVAVVLFALTKIRANLKPISTLLNIISLIIVVMLVGNWISATFAERNSVVYKSDWEKTLTAQNTASIHCPKDPPDIFYIIPDTYTNQDVLQDIYQYDNSAFIKFLKDEDFVVVESAHSNYAQTPLSIASSLNFMYLDNVVAQMGVDSDNRAPLQEMIQNNKINFLLHQCGYKMVAFSSGFGATDMPNAEIYLSPEVAVNDMESELLNLTPLPPLMTVLYFDDRYQLQRERILFTIDELPKIREEYEGPLFVFVHFTAPHHPFVFNADGSAVNPKRNFSLSEDYQGEGKQEYMHGYIQQLAFINTRLKQIIPKIIEQDPEGTIIVLQGDHGSSSQLDWDHPDERGIQERMSILNAYYLPAQENNPLLQTITPVNTFRVILNSYFGADFPILDNTSYFSTLNALYQFKIVK